MKFTWSDQKSIILTRVVVAGAIAGCGIMTVSGPWLTRWMVSANALPPASGPVLLGMGYVCAVLAFVMLVSLYKFLRRIEAGAVFVPANVTALRRISWCCTWAAALCLPVGAVLGRRWSAWPRRTSICRLRFWAWPRRSWRSLSGC